MADLDKGLLNLGFHQLKDELRQKSLMKEHCDWLLRDNHFSTVEAKTRELSPMRVDPFVLNRQPNLDMHEKSQERILEYALFKRWSQPDSKPPLENTLKQGAGKHHREPLGGFHDFVSRNQFRFPALSQFCKFAIH